MLFRGVVGFLAAAQLALGASLQKVADFGSNPTRINMYIYVPDKLATKPAIIVAVSCLHVPAWRVTGACARAYRYFPDASLWWFRHQLVLEHAAAFVRR